MHLKMMSFGDVVQEAHDVQARLFAALAQSSDNVVELFQQWDTDGDGKVDKAEFFRALPKLGLQATDEAAGSLFDTFDADGSGTIELREFEKLLRDKANKGAKPKPSAALPSEGGASHWGALRQRVRRSSSDGEMLNQIYLRRTLTMEVVL